MTESQKEWYEKYNLKRGFSQEEIKEFDQVVGICGMFDTIDDIEYQNRLFNFIKTIIDNPKLDYISKLDKLKTITDTNKSLKLFSDERWNS